MRGVRVRVPATSANLGPAFDCAGLALAVYDEVVVEPATDGLSVEVDGEGYDELARDESHLVVVAVRAAFARFGGRQGGLRVRARNGIPQGRGLGSSAAAVVAGVVAGAALAGSTTGRAGLLALAAELEGHPDNVAACLYGGLTLTLAYGDGTARFAVDPALRAAVLLPSSRLSTSAARRLLPVVVPHADAAANAAAATLLVPALTGRADLLLAATADRLHQEHRRPAMPDSLALVDRLRAAGLAAVVSGAGPSVLVLHTGADVTAYLPAGWRLLEPAVDRNGAVVTVL